MDATAVQGWARHYEQLIDRIGGCFGRHDLRRRAAAYVRGLPGPGWPVRRKNGWQLADYMGDATPHALQRLLGRASWDATRCVTGWWVYAREHPLTEPQVRHLLTAIAWPRLSNKEQALAWSTGLRRHQATARRCHYRARPPDSDARL